jgi:hypothetical protein
MGFRGIQEPATSVTLPASSTDNAIARWDGTGGDALQDSGWTVDDTGNLVSTVADGPTIIGDGAGSTVMLQLRTNDPDTGIGTGASFNQMQLLAGGNGASVYATGIYGGLSNSNGGLLAESATATNPTVVPYGTDQDTGMGRAAADQLSLIAGGFEIGRLSEGTAEVAQILGLQTGVQTFAYNAMTDNGDDTGQIDLGITIPDGAVVIQALATALTGFSGDVSATIQVGDGTDVDRYSTGIPSVFATNASGVALGAVSGTAWHDDAKTVRVTITSNADFSSVSAGQVTITLIWYGPMP